ncbi:MAG TPA: N-methyl-L-tryptophan oxidase [Gemmatimonadaceae bacterium]|nr:N-methyl-L-tryptophan oxidase [Gemmatimonadaceae bacterium]
MTATGCDVMVIGAGAMGSAAAYALARRGVRVTAIDRWAPPHAHGSSHGRTRIIREAYFEHPAYVPLVRRAYHLWAELERHTGRPLFRRTGGLTLGAPDGVLVSGALRSAREHGVEHEVFDAQELKRRFPALAPPNGTVGVHEHRAGILFPERCVESLRAAAREHGAVLETGERALRWDASSASVTVTTDHRVYHARRVILAAGAWLAPLAPALGVPLVVERQVIHWITPRKHPERVGARHLPVAIWEYAPGRMFYVIPDVGDGLKAALHHQGATVDPDESVAPASREEQAAALSLVDRYLHDAAGIVSESAACLYTNTPDGHFVIDAHPGAPQVIVASACSGHGFKFAPAIGEALADLALGTSPAVDVAPFRLSRFAADAPPA